MTVSVWVPIAVALIAAVPVVYSVRTTRRSEQERAARERVAEKSKELELVLTGMSSLVNALQAERSQYAAALRDCQRQLRKVLAT
jgi:heme/copper-type cytochrome/quinol oxidase subunit 2